MGPETDRPRRVADRYVLDERIGHGGAGTVWRGRDTLLERAVAIKQVEIPQHLVDEERATIRARVMREARAAAQLNHRGATIVHDVVEQEGVPYIVMELVSAPTLTDIVQRDGPLQPQQAAEIGLALLDVLEVAHSRGIVHRDVKPSNVMVPAGGQPKLTDFGIASVTDDPRITASGVVMGSPAFMAPEQARGDRVTPATDLWGLGATLYYAVEGVPPFERNQAIATLTAVVHDDHPPLQRAGPLGPVIERLLAKEPGRRPNPADLRSQLESVMAGTAKTVRVPTVRDVGDDPQEIQEESAAGPTATAPTAKATPPISDRREDPITFTPGGARPAMGRLVIAVMVTALLVVLAVLWLGGEPDPVAEPEGVTGQEQAPATERAASPREQLAGEARQPTSATAIEPDDQQRDDGEEVSPVPEDWTTYTPDGSPYTVAHPPDWKLRPLSGNRIDIVDPTSRAYLRMDWTEDPSEDPVADRQAYSEEFASTHDDYREIRLVPTTYRGYEAAIWEYTYREGGAQLHAVNLNITTGERGYALNFQTHADDWDEMGDLFAVFKAGFQPHAP